MLAKPQQRGVGSSVGRSAKDLPVLPNNSANQCGKVKLRANFYRPFNISSWFILAFGGCSENVSAVPGFGAVTCFYSLDLEAVTLFLVSWALLVCIEHDWLHSIWKWWLSSSEVSGCPRPPSSPLSSRQCLLSAQISPFPPTLLSFVRLSGRIVKEIYSYQICLNYI